MRTERPVDLVERRLGGQRLPADGETTDGLSDGHPSDANTDARADGEESDTSLSRWLPDVPADGRPAWLAAVRADPGRAGVIGLGLVGVVAVLVTVFTLMRDDTPPVTSAKLPPVQMVSSQQPQPSSGTAAPDAPVVVSVVGLVHQPGLVTLEPGARVADALTAAGGTLDGADLVGLNMARRVNDGEQIVVGISSPMGAPPVMGSSITAPPDASQMPPASGSTASGAQTSGAQTSGEKVAAPTALVDLNAATVEQLDALPGVGPVTAAAIVAWRGANGRFAGVDQLGEVDGIGPARLEKLRGLVHA